jgi:hypothetical protein
MAIRERAPGTQRRERKQTPDSASIASHVATVVDNLRLDRQKIPNPYELCRRSDMAMAAILQIVAPVLPQIVQEQVHLLISIHDEFYQSAKPSAPQHKQEHEQ